MKQYILCSMCTTGTHVHCKNECTHKQLNILIFKLIWLSSISFVKFQDFAPFIQGHGPEIVILTSDEGKDLAPGGVYVPQDLI